ncbi:MAG TPA: FecR family protein [Kofleriaceae bacterium]
MKLDKRITVEPLDEERLTNIERKLVVAVSSSRPDPVSRRPLVWVAAMIAAAAAVVAFVAHRPAPASSIAIAEPAPQHISIATEAEHSMLALDDATITSDPATKFDVARSSSRVVIDITHGRLDLAVQHRADRVLVIRAGDTEIEDIGTHFSVAYDGTTVDVRVREGEVRVTRDHHDTRVAAGNAWTTSRGLVALDELEPTTTPTTATTTVAIVTAPAPSPPPVPVHRPVAPAPARVAVVPPPPPATAPSDPYVDLRTAIRVQPIAFDPKIDGKADAASEIAKLKLSAYSPTTVGDDASAALYRIAVLLHRPLGQDAAALGTLELYRRRFTNGKERLAAMWLRVRIACGHTIDEECRSAAYSYQREVPTGDAADVAIRITNAQ